MSSDELELGVLRNIEAKLDQLLKWTRFASLQQLRDLLIQNLTNDRELLVYELSDGERTTREIARLASIGSIATIVRYWKNGASLALLNRRKSDKVDTNIFVLWKRSASLFPLML